MARITKHLQLTLALIKPDLTVQPHLVQQIHGLILANKFLVVKSNRLRLSKGQTQVFYAEHKDRFFYERLVNYMSSGPICAYILAKDNAISDWRTLMGPTKVFRTIHTHADSIRGRFGLTDTRNSTHGSDSANSAKREIEFFFADFDYDRWYAQEEHKFRKGYVSFDEKDFIHTVSHVRVDNSQ